MLAVISALKEWRSYLEGVPFLSWLITNQTRTYLNPPSFTPPSVEHAGWMSLAHLIARGSITLIPSMWQTPFLGLHDILQCHVG
jgi:hypothetical protein